MAELPTPVTRDQEFLAALVDEVRGLRADMAAAPNTTSATAELREPVTARPSDPRPARKTTKKATAKKAAGSKPRST